MSLVAGNLTLVFVNNKGAAWPSSPSDQRLCNLLAKFQYSSYSVLVSEAEQTGLTHTLLETPDRLSLVSRSIIRGMQH